MTQPTTLSRGAAVMLIVLCASIAGAIWLASRKDPAAEMRKAIKSGNVARVGELLAQDPALARTRMYPGEKAKNRGLGDYYAIHQALADGNTDLAELLTAHGADMGVRSNGRTLLHEAAYHGQAPSLRWLLARRADIRARIVCGGCAESGQTPLHLAQHGNGGREVNELLLANGAEVDAADSSLRTALHLAAEFSRPDYSLPLCRFGADPGRRDKQGRSAHDVAVATDARGRTERYTLTLGHGEFADWLRPHGGCAKLAALAKKGQAVASPEADSVFREYACERGHRNSCKQPMAKVTRNYRG